MRSIIRRQSNPRRIGLFSLFDVVVVSEPSQIRAIETSPDIDRLHALGTRALPFWVKWFFAATRFWDPKRDLWFLNLESASNDQVAPRRQYLIERIEGWYTPNDVWSIVELLHRNASDDELSWAIAQIVNRRFFEADIPPTICKAARRGLDDFFQVLIPWKYIRARSAQTKTKDYCARNLPQGVHLVDVGHNIGETAQTTALAFKRLKDDLDTPVEEIFTQHALTKKVPRIAVRASTIDGLLRKPTIPGLTIFILEIGNAARQTGSPSFTFGAGSENRACPFRHFFLEFMTEVQTMLKEGRVARAAKGVTS